MNYLDLFSGIGGFSLGLQKSGVVFDKHYFSEVDKNATKIYRKHFPEAVELGSITGIQPGELGKIDIITFGFPCQDLSSSGKRKGITGSRSGLFFEAIRIIKYLKPSIFIFENVKGLLTSNYGKDFEVVLREIADIGIYECEWQLLNTAWLLPIERERVYFIGHLATNNGTRCIFPMELNGTVDVGTVKKLPTIGTKPIGRGECVVIEAKGKRRWLTEIECERLQGFPDGWTDGISATQRYKCIGNAVTVNVVYEIGKRLFYYS